MNPLPKNSYRYPGKSHAASATAIHSIIVLRYIIQESICTQLVKDNGYKAQLLFISNLEVFDSLYHSIVRYNSIGLKLVGQPNPHLPLEYICRYLEM